jgi:hypothetical protein
VQTVDQLNREMAAKQTHCYTCGRRLLGQGYECHVCHEWQCSKECWEKHSKTVGEFRRDA